MERFVFVAAIAIAIIFGIGAVVGGPHFSFHGDWDEEDGIGGTAPVVAVSAGRMEAQTFAGTDLRLRHMAAIVTVSPEDRSDFSVEIDNSAGKLPMPTVASEGGRVIIDGQLRGRVRDCEEGGGASVRGYGEGEFVAADLPRITIHAPRTLNVDRSGAGTTEIGATQELSLDVSGCSLTTAGDVAGALKMDVAGSGDVRAGAAQSLNADVAGSADVTVGAVAGNATVDIAGSGSVTMASLTGELDADGAGSGSVEVQGGAVTNAEIDLAGSGGVTIAAPVERLNVSIVGSGDVDVNGTVGDIEAEIAGSGSVAAQAVTGTVREESWGSGDVIIGGQPSGGRTR
ncbi:MAG: GIN domain-containing protein [Caulobacteraceae bacterium]